MKESIYIILNQYKKENITEEEAVRLIDDLYNNNWNRIIYPTYPPTWPQITYETTTFPKFEVTCKQ